MRMRKTFAAATTRMRAAARRSGPVFILCFETSKYLGSFSGFLYQSPVKAMYIIHTKVYTERKYDDVHRVEKAEFPVFAMCDGGRKEHVKFPALC